MIQVKQPDEGNWNIISDLNGRKKQPSSLPTYNNEDRSETSAWTIFLATKASIIPHGTNNNHREASFWTWCEFISRNDPHRWGRKEPTFMTKPTGSFGLGSGNSRSSPRRYLDQFERLRWLQDLLFTAFMISLHSMPSLQLLFSQPHENPHFYSSNYRCKLCPKSLTLTTIFGKDLGSINSLHG